MPTDKIARLNTAQLDMQILLHRRKLQLAEKRLLQLGVTPAATDAALQQADAATTPLSDGGTIDYDGTGDHYLVDHDTTTVTLRRV